MNTQTATLYGKSAYEVACSNGYVGTEAQWLEGLKAAGEWQARNTRTAFINDVENTPYALRAGFHNSIFRGKNLGASVTDAQWAAIASGKFDDMFIGDYWVIGGIYYRIAHFDYYFNNRGLATKGFEDMNGDILSAECLDSYGYYPKHHILLIPDIHMCDAAMNTEDTKAELYGTCYYRVNARRNIISTLEAAFGAAHLMYWVDNFTTTLYSYSDGSERAGERASFVCQAELPSSIQLTGTHAMTTKGVPVGEGGNLNEGRALGQFALMRLNQAFRQPINMQPGSMLWVDVSYSTRDFVGRGDDGRVNFGLWASHGVITYASGLSPHQIRPYFCIM